MNARELDQLLRSVPLPERPAEYWAEFPRQVSWRLRQENRSPSRAAGGTILGGPRLAWCLALIALCAGLGLWLGFRAGHRAGFDAGEVAGYQRLWTEVNALFPRQVQAIVLEPAGPRIVLADRPNLPEAPPIVVRQCLATGCRTAITFSGQRVRLGGELLEVLTDGAGNVIVATADAVWPVLPGALKIQARTLENLL